MHGIILQYYALLQLYREYISNLPAYLKIFNQLHIENKQLDTKLKEFESDDTCMFRLETMLSMPQKRFTYYVNICERKLFSFLRLAYEFIQKTHRKGSYHKSKNGPLQYEYNNHWRP